MPARYVTTDWADRVLVLTDCDCPPGALPTDPVLRYETPSADGSLLTWAAIDHAQKSAVCSIDGDWAVLVTGPAGPPIGLVVDYAATDHQFRDLLNENLDSHGRINTLHRYLLNPDLWVSPTGQDQAREHDPLWHMPDWVITGHVAWTDVAAFITSGISHPSDLDDWRRAGVPDSVIPSWAAAGFARSPSRAACYFQAGLDPTIALRWYADAPQIAPATAHVLHQAGWSPDKAHRMFQAILRARPGTQFARADLSPEPQHFVGNQALTFLAAVKGVTPGQAVDLSTAGLRPTDVPDPHAIDWDAVATMTALRADGTLP